MNCVVALSNFKKNIIVVIYMKKLKKIVVKVGTSTLTQGSNKLSLKFMLELTRQLAHLHENKYQVILVTSGAIAAGRDLLNHIAVDRSLPFKQMYSAIGQVQLIQMWTQLFSIFNIHVGQLLLTRDDLSNRKRYLNARDTLQCMLQNRIIPVINENDSVATKEIKVGDNDNLAALVANVVGADLLILLTDQKGLFTADPRLDPKAELISVVQEIGEDLFAIAKGSSTKLGTGGMTTKLEAALKASQCGIQTVIASANEANVVVDICAGQKVGTSFMSHFTPKESRKRWLLAERCQGTIYIHHGAEFKILHEGASLLPAGVVKICDRFERGAIVKIIGHDNALFAIGIAQYGSEEISKVIGLHSNLIENILGYTYGAEIVNRTNMAICAAKKSRSHV